MRKNETENSLIQTSAMDNKPPLDRLVHTKEVLKRLDISRTTLWRWCKDGRLPQPLQINETRVAWLESELRQWIAKHPRANWGANSKGSGNE